MAGRRKRATAEEPAAAEAPEPQPEGVQEPAGQDEASNTSAEGEPVMENEGNNGLGTTDTGEKGERMRQVREKAMRAKDSALSAISDTPSWVWAVIAGVVLLMIGVMAASRYRSRPHDYESH